jgi:3-methylcrotonyl-CoA carboxylase alpha subunit
MFTKILIANRGEIACRVAATCARMGLRTVAVYSDADANAKHVAACDEAVHIGTSAPKDSYLHWERIIAAAQKAGAQAIHPGYGFLSENEEFADACQQAGLVFIGPSSNAIKAMGLKAASKQLMEKAGVPLVPGYHGADQNPVVLQQAANQIGYPVLIKASAGGGGKGMRIVEKAEDFAAALASCQREAKGSFGDDAVLIEKYVQRPRHIEIQIFGDQQGNVVYLFERDCSVQRRHQKVLEEAPAPGLTPELRAQMGQAAVAAAKAVNYHGAGTVEFIVEQTATGGMTFFFMEMNTRLQVEHPVTEAITGLDLVEWQLRVASGEPLPLAQHQLTMQGHAIEARICAETPDKQFLPATGTLAVYRKPDHLGFVRATGAAVRVDDGVRQGDTISPYYDSMVAKLIVHGATRQEALGKLDKALSETHIVGLATNVQFLRHVVQSPSFANAELDTALIAREEAHLFHQEKVGLVRAVAAAVVYRLSQEQALQGADPFSQRDGWQSHGTQTRCFAFVFQGQAVQSYLHYGHDGALTLRIQEVHGALDGSAHPEGGLTFRFQGETTRAHCYPQGDLLHIFTAQGATLLTQVDRLAHAGEAPTEGGRLAAPMPGKVVSFAVKAGDVVKKGQTLAVMEAMKMEHTIAAPHDGRVGELMFAIGDQVTDGAELLKLIAP